jgi:hypothetical protein
LPQSNHQKLYFNKKVSLLRMEKKTTKNEKVDLEQPPTDELKIQPKEEKTEGKEIEEAENEEEETEGFGAVRGGNFKNLLGCGG